jgi:acyl carrier protein
MSKIAQLQVIFNEVFENCPTITEETTKADIENWDSLSHLTLILELESAFNLSFEIEQIEQIKSVKDILTYIN